MVYPILLSRSILSIIILVSIHVPAHAQQITAAGQPAQLDIRQAGENSIRVTLKPISFKGSFSFTPAVAERNYPVPVISLRSVDKTINKRVGNLNVEVRATPLTIVVTNLRNEPVQEIIFAPNGNLLFTLNDQPVLGMGEGGPRPERGTPWRSQAVQFDRRGKVDSMQPRWQSDMYGSRNPVAMLVGTEGWGLFIATPWVHVDLTAKDKGVFMPWKATVQPAVQNQRNQHLNQGKGLPPIDEIVPGLYDFFVFDSHDPKKFMKDFSVITGPAAMPPKWALLGDERMSAKGSNDNVSILVLSPKILPLLTVLLGSIVSTAIFLPSEVRNLPKPSINVLFPAPGIPEIPILKDFTLVVCNSCKICPAKSLSSERVLSNREIALLKITRSLFKMPFK